MFAKGVQHIGKLGQVHTHDCRNCVHKNKDFPSFTSVICPTKELEKILIFPWSFQSL